MEFYTDIYESMITEEEVDYGPVGHDLEQEFDTEELTDVEEDINTDEEDVHPITGF